MAQNDKIILDQIISEAAEARGLPNDGPFFQHFALAQLLKDRDLSSDEVDLGLVDGRDDGGIDAWYTVLDGDLIADARDVRATRGAGSVDVFIYTCKRHDTFRLEPTVSLFTSISELFDLSSEEEKLAGAYNEPLLSSRQILRDVLLKTARWNPRVSFWFSYVSRGDAEMVGAAVKARADALVRVINHLFSNCHASFSFIGARELLLAYRKLKDFSARIKFEEGPISRGATNYVGLATLVVRHENIAIYYNYHIFFQR